MAVSQVVISTIIPNNSNGTIPLDRHRPLLFDDTAIPVKVTTLVPRHEMALPSSITPSNHTFNTAVHLPASNGNTRTATTDQSPPAITQSGTVYGLILTAVLIAVVFSAYIRSLCKKSNTWPFGKRSRPKVDEEVAAVVELKNLDNSIA